MPCNVFSEITSIECIIVNATDLLHYSAMVYKSPHIVVYAYFRQRYVHNNVYCARSYLL